MDLFDSAKLRFEALENDFVPSVNDRLRNIVDFIDKNEEAQKVLPGLAEMLDTYTKSPVSVDQIDFIRDLLRVFKDSPDNTYEKTLANYDPDEQAALEKFVDGERLRTATDQLVLGPTLGARQEARGLGSSIKIDLPLTKDHTPEDDGGIHTQLSQNDQTSDQDKTAAIVENEPQEHQTFALSKAIQFHDLTKADEATFQKIGVTIRMCFPRTWTWPIEMRVGLPGRRVQELGTQC